MIALISRRQGLKNVGASEEAEKFERGMPRKVCFARASRPSVRWKSWMKYLTESKMLQKSGVPYWPSGRPRSGRPLTWKLLAVRPVREISGRAQVRVRAHASTILPHTTFHHIYTFILCFDKVQSTSSNAAPSLDIL